jgi:hypothetical protein
MTETSNRRSDAIALEAIKKRERGIAETNNSPARVRELLGPVCTENPIRIDWGRESPKVSAQ